MRLLGNVGKCYFVHTCLYTWFCMDCTFYGENISLWRLCFPYVSVERHSQLLRVLLRVNVVWMLAFHPLPSWFHIVWHYFTVYNIILSGFSYSIRFARAYFSYPCRPFCFYGPCAFIAYLIANLFFESWMKIRRKNIGSLIRSPRPVVESDESTFWLPIPRSNTGGRHF